MTVQDVSTTKVDIDPRVERSRVQVLHATLELLGEVGYGDLTIEAVAARSGVAKSTIYRHWKGKLELVTDAFHEMKVAEPPPAPGPVAQRVTDLLMDIARNVIGTDWRVNCLPALIEASARCPEVADVSRDLAEAGMSRVKAVLDDGVAVGELPAELDTMLLADALTGPIFLRGLFHRRPVQPDEVPGLVALLLPSPPSSP
ncbi:MAG TPA: TetR/AcrR family transcriptional regulator [Acidimicrobiales bacterium]|nr:TetR/AcrR family transcriptional regulator [Acidimicrobiales bacterium]